MRKDADAGSVDATWRISSSLRMCARQDCFVFERPQVVFYCKFSSSRHVSKSANLIGRIVFDTARQTKKTNPRRFFDASLTHTHPHTHTHTHSLSLSLTHTLSHTHTHTHTHRLSDWAVEHSCGVTLPSAEGLSGS